MSLTENTITVGNLKWFYHQVIPEEGTNKSPVLLLHGIPAHSFIWCAMMPILEEYGLKAIAPDWIGCGASDQPDKRDFKYTPDAYIKALEELMAALELEKVSLIVQGFLGSVGIQYALRNSEQIDRLIILNTPLSDRVKLPWQMRQWSIPFVGDMLTQDPLLVDRSLEGGSGFVISNQDLAIYRKPFVKASSAGRSLMAIVKNLQLQASMTEINSGLEKLEKPMLIIWGMADPWLSAEDAEILVKTNSQIELKKLPEAKHYPQEHWFEEITPMIVNFLGRQGVTDSKLRKNN